MRPQSFVHFLKSLAALPVHLVCGGAIVLLTIGFITGDAPPDGLLALLFCVVVYPFLL